MLKEGRSNPGSHHFSEGQNMQLKSILAAAALTASLIATAPASAAAVHGSFAPSDGLLNNFSASTTSIVSGLLSFNLGANFAVGSCSVGSTFALDGCPIAGSTQNQPINYGTAGQYITYDGIVFNIAAFGGITTTAFSCDGTFCSDSIHFNMVGLTSAGVYSASPFIWSFTATGTCNEDGLSAQCVAGTASGSWAGSVTATGPLQTPEPGTLVLLGLGMAALGFARRRKLN
jgi:hypothetical protein